MFFPLQNISNVKRLLYGRETNLNMSTTYVHRASEITDIFWNYVLHQVHFFRRQLLVKSKFVEVFPENKFLTIS